MPGLKSRDIKVRSSMMTRCNGVLMGSIHKSKAKKVEKVDGEAYVNVCKVKITPGYEISANFTWKGKAKDGEGKTLLKADSNVEIPYITDENADMDPEVKVTVKGDGLLRKALKEAMLAKGKPLILEEREGLCSSHGQRWPC